MSRLNSFSSLKNNDMKRGKQICETLKGIRSEIAQANEIDYTPRECHHEGDCAGTCPACESEMRWLEGQLRLRQSLGKAVTIAGLSLGLATLGSCSSCAGDDDQLEGGVIFVCDTTSIDNNELVREGDVIAPTEGMDSDEWVEEGEVVAPTEGIITREPAKVDGVTQPEDPNDNREHQ